ncbi:MAG: slipin family protein, partial [Xanthomonadales bacterium]|nr:slipin family protein [Xanthomonadales bacterium]
MFWTRKIVIGDGERGLVHRDRRFEAVLSPGVHLFFDPLKRVEVSVHDLAQTEYRGNDRETLISVLGARLSEHFVLADVGVEEVGLVSRNGRLCEVLPPGTRALFWRGPVEVGFETLSLSGGLTVPATIATRLKQIGLLDRVAVSLVVPAEHCGLVHIDGALQGALAPGFHAYWNFRKNVVLELVDQRVQSVDVAGQELLTRDKVSLRVNLAASYRVVDPVAARTQVAKYAEHVYRELQYGLRRVVALRTLDELLGDKLALDGELHAGVRERVAAYGIEVQSVGIKDVILPGEMREILNGVVQAEKLAQANVIRRREESNATRSLLNTAKLIEESPTLMRLKALHYTQLKPSPFPWRSGHRRRSRRGEPCRSRG